MSYRPPGTLGVLRLLAWNAVVRLLRAANVQKARRQREQQSVKPKRRQATARKSGTGLMWLMVLMVPLFLFQATMMSGQAVTNLSAAAHRTAPGGDRLVLSKHVRRKLMFRAEMTEREFRDVLDAAGVDESYRPPRARILEAFRAQGLGAFEAPSTAYAQMDENGIPWRSEQARALFTQCAAVLLLLFAAMSLLSAFGAANATLGGGDWVQWWLLTFPVATRSLVLARVLEYSLVQFFPWFTLFPLTWLVLEALGQPWPAAVAIGATLVTTFLGGAVRLWGETQLRLRCSLHTLRNVQGACTLLSLTLIGTAFWVALSDETPFVFVDFAGSLPAALTLLPASWPIGLRVFGPLAAVLGVLVTAAAFVGSVAATSRALRGGAMRTGGVDAGSRGRANAWRRGRGMGVGGKELSLLRRDRTFLVQTLLVPLF
ncbi:MAG: hypothetical protein KAI24_25395, partial [Planctomycetes bacterium]|nr:hypothetical protein [Planctomycetota bacterium]